MRLMQTPISVPTSVPTPVFFLISIYHMWAEHQQMVNLENVVYSFPSSINVAKTFHQCPDVLTRRHVLLCAKRYFIVNKKT